MVKSVWAQADAQAAWQSRAAQFREWIVSAAREFPAPADLGARPLPTSD
jgi:hypothetical protein